MIVYRFDSQTFSFSTIDVDGIELPALYSLQHRLARNPQNLGRVLHRYVAVGGVFDEARAELFGDANLPWRAGCELFTGDEAVVEPTVDGRGCNAKDFGCLLDVDQFTVGRLVGWLEARDVPMPTEIADAVSCKPVTVGSGLALAVEDAGDHGIGVMRGQTAYEFDGVFLGADRGWARAWSMDVELGERTAAPAKCEVGAILVAVVGDNHFLEERAQQLFSVPWAGCGRVPCALQIFAQTQHGIALVGSELTGASLFTANELGLCLLELAQPLLPFRVHAASPTW